MPYKDKEKQREAQRKWDRKNRVGKRHQVWTGIFYEESSPDWRDWCSELEDIHATMLEMRAFIVERNVTEFDLFQLWCDENNDTWSRALDLKCSWAIGNFIERRRNRIQQCAKLERERRRDNETDSEPGE